MTDTPAEDILTIPAILHDAMVDHCEREAPLECCGLLGGVFPLVSSIHPLRNTDASETRYNADPQDLIHGREGGAVGDAITAAKAVEFYRRQAPTGKNGLQDMSTKKDNH